MSTTKINKKKEIGYRTQVDFSEKHPMTAQDLYDYLRELSNDGVNLNRIDLSFRKDVDNNIQQIVTCEEHEFDGKLDNIVFIINPSEV